MNNTVKILFLNIQWFLNENNTDVLEKIWEQSIKDFIYNGYKEGSFEVEFKGEIDYLRWYIDFSKQETN